MELFIIVNRKLLFSLDFLMGLNGLELLCTFWRDGMGDGMGCDGMGWPRAGQRMVWGMKMHDCRIF